MSHLPCSSYALNEPVDIIHDEVAWLQGAFLSSLLCGVQITLSAMSFFAVLKQRLHRRLRIALLLYIAVLCMVMTTGQQSSLLFIQAGFVEERNYPGGPNMFLSARFTAPIDLAATCLFVFANWMMESLLVWRCKVVCKTGDRPMWFGVIFPIALLLSEFVTGGVFLYQLCQRLRHNLIISAITYSSLSLLLNVTVTGIIAIRLLLHRRRLVRQFGPGHGSDYVSAATILVESASLYTGFLILFLVFTFVGTPATNILQQLLAPVESIASLLIIYRIAQGKGWRDDTGVTSADWRGNSEPEVARVNLEALEDPGMQPSLSSKDETPILMRESSVNPSLAQGDVV